MVWFYLQVEVLLAESLVNRFQSHYGLILSYNGTGSEQYNKTLSIPLWSDFIPTKWYTKEPSIFQSHYGLILSWTIRKLHNTKTSFQSHYGLILSSFVSFFDILLRRLSIPLWSDFIILSFSTSLLSSSLNFQSHYGLILSRSQSCSETSTISYLSIPLWSDFICEDIAQTFNTQYNFQSHYGLILSIQHMRSQI